MFIDARSLSLLATLLFAPVAVGAAPTYTFSDLGNQGSAYVDGGLMGINNAGRHGHDGSGHAWRPGQQSHGHQ
jgi:hypothetical protein